MISRNAWPLVALVAIVLAAIIAIFALRQSEALDERRQASAQATLCLVYWTGSQELHTWEPVLRTAQTLRNRLLEATPDHWLEPGFRREIESMTAFQLVLLSSLDEGLQQFCSSEEAVNRMQSAHASGFPPTDGQTPHGVGRWSFRPDAAAAQINIR